MARSRVAELAAEEAARAEADDSDEDEDEGTDENPEPNEDEEADEEEHAPTEAPDAEASANVRDEKIGQEVGKHLAALEAIFGAEWETFTLCPLCTGLGATSGPSMRQDSSKRRCDHCDGLGAVLSGASNPEYAAVQCPKCMGTGYIGTGESVVPNIAPTSIGNGANESTYTQPIQAAPAEPEYVIPPMPVWDASINDWRTPDGQRLMAAG